MKNIGKIFIAAMCVLFISNNATGAWLNYKSLQKSTAAIAVKSNPLVQSIPEMHKIGTCYDSTLHYAIAVYTAPDLGPAIGGEFFTDQFIIVLKNTDIETIAHEASHAVDSIVLQKGITDGETRAYIQGSLTGCIEEHVLFAKSELACMPDILDTLNTHWITVGNR